MTDVGTGETVRVPVPWGADVVLADVVGVSGAGPCRQVRLVLASDPACPDPDRPVEVSLHITELAPDVIAAVLAGTG